MQLGRTGLSLSSPSNDLYSEVEEYGCVWAGAREAAIVDRTAKTSAATPKQPCRFFLRLPSMLMLPYAASVLCLVGFRRRGGLAHVVIDWLGIFETLQLTLRLTACLDILRELFELTQCLVHLLLLAHATVGA